MLGEGACKTVVVSEEVDAGCGAGVAFDGIEGCVGFDKVESHLTGISEVCYDGFDVGLDFGVLDGFKVDTGGSVDGVLDWVASECEHVALVCYGVGAVLLSVCPYLCDVVIVGAYV